MKPKVCTKCGELKPLSDYYPMRGMRDGHRNDCIECHKAGTRARNARDPEPNRARARQWAAENPERRAAYQAEYRRRPERKRDMRDRYYRRTYGLSADEADARLAQQDGRCAICRQPAPERLGAMHLDHDHETGQIRGFLCVSCNQGLGQFHEDPSLLLRAVVYLRHWQHPGALTG